MAEIEVCIPSVQLMRSRDEVRMYMRTLSLHLGAVESGGSLSLYNHPLEENERLRLRG